MAAAKLIGRLADGVALGRGDGKRVHYRRHGDDGTGVLVAVPDDDGGRSDGRRRLHAPARADAVHDRRHGNDGIRVLIAIPDHYRSRSGRGRGPHSVVPTVDDDDRRRRLLHLLHLLLLLLHRLLHLLRLLLPRGRDGPGEPVCRGLSRRVVGVVDAEPDARAGGLAALAAAARGAGAKGRGVAAGDAEARVEALLRASLESFAKLLAARDPERRESARGDAERGGGVEDGRGGEGQEARGNEGRAEGAHVENGGQED